VYLSLHSRVNDVIKKQLVRLHLSIIRPTINFSKFPLSASTMLVGRQEGRPACKMIMPLELGTRYPCSRPVNTGSVYTELYYLYRRF